jgi:MFS family permease
MTIITALVFFIAGTIVSAVAHRPWILIFGRTVQGIGGGGVLALTYILMADLFTLQERAKYVSFLTLVYLVGTVCGPVIGGGLAYRASWVREITTAH